MLATLPIRIKILLLAACIGGSCFAASNDIETAILSFPKVWARDYRPDTAVESANALIAAGKEAACAALEKAAKPKHELAEQEELNEKVCHLCRLIFVPNTEAQRLRAPRFGALQFMPYNSMDAADWPYLPFAI